MPKSTIRRCATALVSVAAAAITVSSCADTTPTTAPPLSQDAAAPVTAAPLPVTDPVLIAETAFVTVLTDRGFPFGDAQLAVTAGRATCGVLDTGSSAVATVVEVREAYNSGAGYAAISHAEAATFVGASVGAFCPWNNR